MDLLKNIKKLEGILSTHSPLIVAYSGGMDSSFLAIIAKRVLGDNMTALSIESPFSIPAEIDFTREFTLTNEIKHAIISANPLEAPDITENDALRCYYCKKLIFSRIREYAEKNGFLFIADGSNLSDDDDYRPGKKALIELNIISPLKMAGFTKGMIAEALQKLNIRIPFKYSNACLASRIPYGTEITEEILGIIREGEAYLADAGLEPVRLRYHNQIARIETSNEGLLRIAGDDKLRSDIILKLKKLGFEFITIDIVGFRSGSMNALLKKDRKKF